MTVPIREGECWTVEDGAPDGVAFDFLTTDADGTEYRIVRQEHLPPGTSGYVIHSPKCKAWREGRHQCIHLLRAIELAEQPLRRFALDVLETYPLAATDEEGRARMAAAMYQDAQRAIRAADELERYEDRKSRERVTHLEAVAEFDRGPLGAAR